MSHKTILKTSSQFLIVLLLSFAQVSMALAQTAVVRAVLFYSPSCPHCHLVINETLPPLFEKYGEQLQIIGVDVSQPNGQMLYTAFVQQFEIPEERYGVPALVIDDIVLVGSGEIPEQLPGLIEEYLAQGGVDWPDIPGLREAVSTAQSADTDEESSQAYPGPEEEVTPSPEASETVAPTQYPAAATPTSGLVVTGETDDSLSARFGRDPLGNGLAVVVLVLMVFSLGGVFVLFQRADGAPLSQGLGWLIPVLCIIGLVVAGYLAFVETTDTTAVCGPVGDCNTVQQSEYALLFGFLPIGVMGLIGYVAIIIAWLLGRFREDRLAQLATLALFGMSLFGVLFSIYLTFLEPFVIGATCAWCLTSAVLMTALLWLSVVPGKWAWTRWKGDKGDELKRRVESVVQG